MSGLQNCPTNIQAAKKNCLTKSLFLIICSRSGIAVGHWKCLTQLFKPSTEKKIVKMSDDPSLVNEKLYISPSTSFQLSQN